jgi:hypothetical protein
MNLEENPLDVEDEMIEEVEESSIPQKLTNHISPKIDVIQSNIHNLKPHSIIENAKS